MRQVTGGAVLSDRRMNNRSGEPAIIMAAQTELTLGLLEHRGVVGAVRIVALRTVPGSRMLMARRQPRLLLRVAPEAQVGLFSLQLESAHESMRLVAGRAVALDQRCVGLTNRAHHFRVALEASASLLESSTALQLCLSHRKPTSPRITPRTTTVGRRMSPSMSVPPCGPASRSCSGPRQLQRGENVLANLDLGPAASGLDEAIQDLGELLSENRLTHVAGHLLVREQPSVLTRHELDHHPSILLDRIEHRFPPGPRAGSSSTSRRRAAPPTSPACHPCPSVHRWSAEPPARRGRSRPCSAVATVSASSGSPR